MCPRLVIIYLKGRNRSWTDESVEFLPIKSLYSSLQELGFIELVKKFEMLRRGVLEPHLQKKLEDYLASNENEET